MLFVGAHERQLDDKGRLALPAPYRAHLGERCYLVKGRDKCVDVIPESVFEDEAATVKRQVQAGEVHRHQQRALFSSATLVNVDKQGRINLDERLRGYAEIAGESSVMVAGNYDRLEIWSPERFERVTAEGTSDMAGDDDPA